MLEKAEAWMLTKVPEEAAIQKTLEFYETLDDYAFDDCTEERWNVKSR